ncbi:ribosomal RNA methyltransferase FtsJ domain-containing protein [Collybia nuda]|uniref:rRNA methyltransferase 2, mitochondrial n=1 Tax=Collybia nuda TaxID=64659 RepID=A0A9P5XW06_9AGAR|nr:ribosomal RNA methyltransferase FtsJ domain-containing protein [Collybia nuda]
MFFRPTVVLLSKTQKPASKAWVARQSRDPYVKQRQSYRARSAFKLLEIDALGNYFLGKPDVKAVIDLGAAPGGWSQVVAAKLGWTADPEDPPLLSSSQKHNNQGPRKERHDDWKKDQAMRKGVEMRSFDPLNIEGEDFEVYGRRDGRGTIISVDLLKIQPIQGVHTIQADFLSPQATNLIHPLLAVKGNPAGKVDIILSDMAANSSGNDVRDIESSLEICNAVFGFAQDNLRSAEQIGRKKGGVVLMKHFTHPLLHEFRVNKLEPNFYHVTYVKPYSSRSESREGYFLCQGWKGI